MILTGPEIARRVKDGSVGIDPFDPARLNPNSYNLRLGYRLLVFPPDLAELSTREAAVAGRDVIIPAEGYVLRRGWGYLAHTVEQVRCEGVVPVIDGRSSFGRLFTLVHCTAGFGDDGFDGQWTLEVVPLVRDVRVFAEDEILQVRFHSAVGERKPYQGRYQGQRGPVPGKGCRPTERGDE